MIQDYYNRPLQSMGWSAAILSIILISSLLNFIPISYQEDNNTQPQAGATENGNITTDAVPPVSVLAALTNVIVAPTNNIYKTESHYVVSFSTATTGTIKTITILFPTGFDVSGAKLIEASGIGTGTISVSSQTVSYTVTSPASVPSGQQITIMMGKIINRAVASNQLTITTKDPSNVVIDGPTLSIAFALTPIGTLMIGTSAINSAKILDGSITKADVASGSGIVTGAQSCLGKIVTGADSNGNLICKFLLLTQDRIEIPVGSGDVGQYTSIAIGTDGFPVISYYDATSLALKLVHCKNVKCSQLDPPPTIGNGGNEGQYTSIAIGIDGFPVISYYDVIHGGNLRIAHCTNVSCSTFDTPVNPDLGSVGTYTSIAIGTDGFPMISYYDAGFKTLKVLHCKNMSCTQNDTPISIDSGDVGQYTSIAIGTDGFPVISYYDNTNGDLKLIHCTNIACTTRDSPTTLDTSGVTGQYTSITIGTDGFPIISYLSFFLGGHLALIHCTNIPCSTFDTSIPLDSANNVGLYTSIKIGIDGFPVISYFDLNNLALKFLHCTSITCNTHELPTTIDGSGNTGYYTSLAIGIDGLPVISYYDNTSHDLKVLHKGGIEIS